MPIGDRPLLEFWLETLHESGIRHVLVNLNYHAEIVQRFLERPKFKGWVQYVHEVKLLGTAGTLIENKNFFHGYTTLLIHADNWCQCDFDDFLEFHQKHRPKHCPITMMTFDSSTPHTCGIVETDVEDVVIAIHEKSLQPPGKRANAAVYLLEPEVLDWLVQNPKISDFSTEVLTQYLGRIATWHNSNIHRDIGTQHVLQQAQYDPKQPPVWPEIDLWQQGFLRHDIFQQIAEARTR